MEYSEIKVPYIGNTKIRAEAEKFCQEYWDSLLLPVDVEKIIDVAIEIDPMQDEMLKLRRVRKNI
ncbi:hypothetical protein ACFL23_04340 [Patescibacteria group bacterium]